MTANTAPKAENPTFTLRNDQTGEEYVLPVFNGSCGAESGWVPVSAVSPSLMLTKLEIERGAHDRTKPPLLAPALIAFCIWRRTPGA